MSSYVSAGLELVTVFFFVVGDAALTGFAERKYSFGQLFESYVMTIISYVLSLLCALRGVVYAELRIMASYVTVVIIVCSHFRKHGFLLCIFYRAAIFRAPTDAVVRTVLSAVWELRVSIASSSLEPCRCLF